MRSVFVLISLVAAAAAATSAGAKERATFITGQYATAEQCAKLRNVEKGGPENVETAPELLDADGFRNWEGGCSFTKIYEHEPGASWLTFMVCTEGMTMSAASYIFVKTEKAIEVYGADQADGPEIFTRCDPSKGN